MQSFLLVGTQDKTDTYIKSFICDKFIKSYNVYHFEGRIKIADIRELQKKITFKKDDADSVLCIFSGDITIEAQNALLKTLEEVPKNTYIIITSDKKESLLPTILSRCTIMNLGNFTVAIPQDFMEIIRKNLLSNYSVGTALLLAQECGKSDNNKENIDTLLLSLRALALQELTEGKDPRKLKKIISLTKELLRLYPLITVNNINYRLALENSFMKQFDTGL